MDRGSEMSKQSIFDIPLAKVGKMGVSREPTTEKPKVRQYRDTKRTSRS
jgi:hypothetical protein